MLFANDEKNVIALACAISQNSLVQMIVPLALDEHHVYIYTHSKNKQEEVCTKTTFELIIASHTQRVYYCFVCRFFFTRMYGMYVCVLNAHCRRFRRHFDYINVYTALENYVYIF